MTAPDAPALTLGKAVAKAISGAKFELIDGMGHDIPPHFIPYLSELFADHFKS
jgi:hypothetical protein